VLPDEWSQGEEEASQEGGTTTDGIPISLQERKGGKGNKASSESTKDRAEMIYSPGDGGVGFVNELIVFIEIESWERNQASKIR
jgi:hypothetical protein